MGTWALAVADLEYDACGISPLGRRFPLAPLQSHKADDPQTVEQLYPINSHTVKKALGSNQISQHEDVGKGLRTPKEFAFGGHWELITELPQTGERDFWRAQIKPCAHQDPGERSSVHTRD